MELKVFLFRLFLAIMLGAGVGLERQIKQRSAGLVTNALVSLGAALYILTALTIKEQTGDVLRVLGQIVTGIGFLGAGVIMRDGFTIHGLNTAATLWCSAAIGSAAGFGLYVEATAGAAMVVAAHSLLKPVVDYINKRPYIKKTIIRNIGYLVTITGNMQNEEQLKILSADYLNKQEGLQLRLMRSTYDNEKEKVEIQMEILSYEPNQAIIKQLITQLSKLQIVSQIQLDPLHEEIENNNSGN